ncbi:MAG: helix-turn-helix domain-containing protein [Defluviitaleaceae bacterium]|nr:helix-turn-helix domain-containing protein [Defluviitaleaceae bacterium]
MYYMTAQQAAEKWGVSLRWVQAYLKDSRIEGAIRFGHAWMIPNVAQKPADRRFKKKDKTDEGGKSNEV